MEQKLAEQNIKKSIKTTTQVYRVRKIWDQINKSSFEEETEPVSKEQKKSDLYTLISKEYQEKFGKEIKRSTIRRCVNTYINTSKQG